MAYIFSDSLFWHCIWHSILTSYSGILSGIYSDILSGILSGPYSDILSGIFFWHSFWHCIWRSFLVFYLASILTFSLTWTLPGLNRKRLVAEVPRLRPAVPTEIWGSLLRWGSARCDLELAVEMRQCALRCGARGWGPAVPTEIWSSWLRSGSAHCYLELAAQVRQWETEPRTDKQTIWKYTGIFYWSTTAQHDTTCKESFYDCVKRWTFRSQETPLADTQLVSPVLLVHVPWKSTWNID